MIQTLTQNAQRICPNAFGFLMCDFIQTNEAGRSEVYAIDPGLRPSASTPSAMAQLWVKEARGTVPFVRNDLLFSFEPGVDYAAVQKRLGELTDPDHIRTTGRGVVPFSWEPRYGTGRLMAIAHDLADFRQLREELSKRSGGALS